MIRRLLEVGLLATLLMMLGVPNAQGGLMFELDAGTTDLSAVTVGDSFTVEVLLSGLGEIGTASELAELVGSLVLPNEFALDPGSLTKGVAPTGVVPNGDDLFLFETAGLVDANFLALFENISTNGLFFSFELTALTSGSGSIDFDPFSLLASDGNFFPQDLSSTGLAYSVSANSGAVVPEPGTMSYFATALVGGTIIRRRRRRCR